MRAIPYSANALGREAPLLSGRRQSLLDFLTVDFIVFLELTPELRSICFIMTILTSAPIQGCMDKGDPSCAHMNITFLYF
jgi:hypothetical protein